MSEILILYAHPNEQKSSATGPIASEIERSEGVTVRRLYDLYPDFFVAVEAEQTALTNAKHVVLMFPFYWYSVPALMKEWIDCVLTSGWAYGEGGTALKGKTFTVITSTGSAEAQYDSDGVHIAQFHDFLLPLKGTASLCHMDWQEPIWLPAAASVSAEQSNEWTNTVKSRLSQLSQTAVGVKS